MTTRQIVIVGGGMVGTRFAGDLVQSLDRIGADARITLVGEEPHAPYNRVLLSDVIAGRTSLAALALPDLPLQVTELRGAGVTEIDREGRRVRLQDGARLPYDELVLATGARARLPRIPGMLDGSEPGHGVRVLRTLDDARGLLAAAAVGGRFAVLGGGVLGVEVAAGLRERGGNVTLLHTGTVPMERQLDPGSACVLSTILQDRGITVVGDAEVLAVSRTDGRLRGLLLADDRFVAADTLVVTAGTRPAIELAAAAGLAVDHGVLVDDELRCLDDARISAIGDCAQPPGGTSGLIGPGWDQARRLARRFAGEPIPTRGPGRQIVRLKAGSISAVTLGKPRLLNDPGPLRVIGLDDHGGRRSIRIATDGRTLRAAVCVGAAAIAAELQVIFERGLPLPVDPAHLLVDRTLLAAPADDTSITKIPDTATLCRCNGVTKGQVIAAYRAGDRSVAEVAGRTRATTGCGGCAASVAGVLEWLCEADPDQNADVQRSSRPTGSPRVRPVASAEEPA